MLNEVNGLIKSFHFNKINFSKIFTVLLTALSLHAGFSFFLGYIFNSAYVHSFGMLLTEYLGFSTAFYKTQLLVQGLAAFVAVRVGYQVSMNRNIEMLPEKVVRWLQECYRRFKNQIINILGINLNKDNSAQKLESKSFVTKLLEGVKNMLSSASHVFKRFVATIIPPRLFFRLGNVLPIGGWIEHVPFPEDVLDDFQYAVLCESAEEVKIMLAALPKETLYRLLDKKDSFNHPALYTAAISNKKEAWYKTGDKFRYILEAIEPAHRVRYLQAVINEGLIEGPIVKHLDLSSDADVPYWEIIKELLTFEQQKQLVQTHDTRGDSLLQSKAFTRGSRDMLSVLEPLSVAERKAYLMQLCPHGKTPMLELFAYWKMDNVEPVFAMLPPKDWQDVFNMQPEGWTMNVGEKIMAMCYSDQEESSEHIKYLRENYALELPERYRKLDADEQEEVFEELKESLKSTKCDLKENFKKQYGNTPEAILGLEPFLEASAYVPAYRKLQKEYHPDRYQGDSGEMSAKVNVAKKFIDSKEERDKYESESILNNPDIWNILTRKP